MFSRYNHNILHGYNPYYPWYKQFNIRQTLDIDLGKQHFQNNYQYKYSV